MPDTSFTIMFDGKFRQGHTPEEVKTRLATLFKASPEQIDQLCANAPVPVKKGLNQEQAARYAQTFERAGALCRIVKERSHPNIDRVPSPIPQKPSPRAKKTSTVEDFPKKQSTKAEAGPGKTRHVCPKCGLQQDAERVDCLRCGIVFARFHSYAENDDIERATESQERRRSKVDEERSQGKTYDDDLNGEEEEEEGISPLSVEREGWLSLAGGAVITALVLCFPFLNYIFSYLVVLVHELGHTVSHWLFGYPSIPAFDFMYGGGVAIYQSRQPILLVLIYLCFGYLFYLFRRNLPTVAVFTVFVAAYSLAAYTPMHEVISLLMGHGFELLFATIFLYRAISGSAVIVAIERPLYGFLGLFIECRDIRFAYQLMSSHAYRADYEAAKGGGHWMDFSRIAEEYLRVDLAFVAGFFLICCVIPPLAAFLAYRYRSYWMSALSKILNPEPE